MKKLLLTASAFCLLATGTRAQQAKLANPTPLTESAAEAGESPVKKLPNFKRCATPVPPAGWDEDFNRQVEEYKAKLETAMLNGKTASTLTATSFTIPVVFHVIHGGQAVGTYPNLAQAQINSQVTAMNQDYSGTGYKANTYSSNAFVAYAAAATNSVSAASKDAQGRVAIANIGITFVLATKDPNGTTLAEPGIDRISYVAKGWTNPATLTSSNFQTYIDGTIKPASKWDVTKYFNVWLTDEDMSSANSPQLLGYSTFPPSSGLTGLSAPYGNSNTDGCWFWSKVCGSKAIYASGTYDATYCYGRTICHECGHYLGLRHPWGDNGQCNGTDYCNDTPPEKGQATNTPYGCWYGTPTYPTNAGACTYGGQTNTNGDMFMNIMDYTDDIAMYMFTNDQKIRMQTAMNNSPNRNQLTASAVAMGATTTTYSAPVAAFSYPANICANSVASFTDASTGPPVSWNWTSNPATGVTITTNTVQNPSITFANPGTYTISLAVTNTVGTNSTSHVITVTSCTTSSCDTLSNINGSDTLTVYLASGGGYFFGRNSYGFTGFAEQYAQSQFPTSMQVKGAIIAFYRKSTSIGTHGTGTVSLSMVNGTTPGGTAAATKTFSLSSVAATTATTSVHFAGNPALAYSTPIIVPYVVTFASPVGLTSDFFLTVTPPTTTGDTLAIMSGRVNHSAANTAWVKYSGSWGDLQTLTTGTANPTGSKYSLAIIPIACPQSTGIENNELGTNIMLFPNPTSGVFNLAVALPEATNLNINIVNMIGQSVYSKTENNVMNSVFSVDLSHLAKGVYYATILDSNNNKTVKKIIIE